MLIRLSLIIVLTLEPFLAIYPHESETRTRLSLDGLWWFAFEPHDSIGRGLKNKWWTLRIAEFQNSTKIPVPCSFNDLFEATTARFHLGWAWYQKNVYFGAIPKNTSVLLRFESVNYFSIVWLDNTRITSNEGGHLPFEVDVTDHVTAENIPHRLTVAVNNTLSDFTLPPGKVKPYTSSILKQTLDFDFFNYAGILRSVYAYFVPRNRIIGLTINTDNVCQDGLVHYSAKLNHNVNEWTVKATLFDAKRNVVNESVGNSGQIVAKNAHFWWPIGFNESIGYLYRLELKLVNKSSNSIIDVYHTDVGIRKIKLINNKLTINGVPVYLTGCGMHEDFHIIGRGYNAGVMIKDLNLITWLGANCFRTSHYPYSEERMFEADRRGIMVIDETPAVGTRNYEKQSVLSLHQAMIDKLIDRDKNHPSVIMWSLANEPTATDGSNARIYFKNLFHFTKRLDSSRPITLVLAPYSADTENTADLFDVISLNRYYGWYRDHGDLDAITAPLLANIGGWYKKYKKPILLTEYGADTIAGFHQVPATAFTEEFQVEFMKKYHEAFDTLRNSCLIGEMFWNFADFDTAQTTTRVNGNKKGVFTRERRPKMSAHLIRQRYHSFKFKKV